MCELLGGEDRIEPKSANWNDGFIVKLGATEMADGQDGKEDRNLDPRDFVNWHVDGDSS
jgi:hypothetical protein